jgi:hypothetical protein
MYVRSAPKIGWNSKMERMPRDHVYDAEQITFLAKNVRMLRKITPEFHDTVKRLNPHLVATVYIGSTYMKAHGEQWPPAEVERKLKWYLAMTPTAELAHAIDADTRTLTLAPFRRHTNAKTAKQRNADEIALHPSLFAATTEAEHTSDWDRYVFWIRVDDELMRVESWDAERWRITVRRGYEGTVATDHAKASVVTTPMMCGKGLKGKPGQKPQGGEFKGFIYVMDKRPDCEPIFAVKARHIVEVMREGFDGVEMDVMTASVPMFNMVDALGRKAAPWDFTKKREYSVYDWVTGHERQINYMQNYVKAQLGRWPYIGANGVSLDSFEEGEGTGGYCKRLLVPTAIKPRPMDQYNTEKGLAAVGEQWPAMFKTLQTCFQQKLSVNFQSKLQLVADENEFRRRRDYTLANFYLAFEPDEEGYLHGGPSVEFKFFSAYWEFGIGGTYHSERNGLTYKLGLPYPLFLPLGKPLDAAEPGNLDAYRYKETQVFTRPYENGLVLVNPTGRGFTQNANEASVDIELEDMLSPEAGLNVGVTYTVKLDREYLDPESGQYVTEVHMPPCTGRMLLLRPTVSE